VIAHQSIDRILIYNFPQNSAERCEGKFIDGYAYGLYKKI